jgi:uncharacterized protein (TIGR03067 family)
MPASLLLVATASLLLAADTPKQPKEKKDEDKLVGTWIGQSFTYLAPRMPRGGPPGFGKEQREEITKATWVIAKDKIKIKFNKVLTAEEKVASIKEETRELAIKVNWTKNPPTIDLTPCSFPYMEVLTGTSEGILELDGDTLKICYGVPGDERPAGFAAEVNTFYFVFVLKREASAKDKLDPKKE